MSENKPRWEKKYEEYKNEGAKYENIKAELETLKEGKVTGDFKTKQEYQNAVEDRNKDIAEKEKQVKGYENFKKNRSKIAHILKYRNDLIKEMNDLPRDTRQEFENKKKELDARESRIAQYQNEIEDIKNQLKQELPDEEKQILLFTLKTKMDSMEILQTEQGKLEREVADLEKIGKDFDENAEAKKKIYERRIEKCDSIARQLLNGVDIENVEPKSYSADEKLTSPDGKLPAEVEKAREAREAEKTIEEEKEVKPAENINAEPEVVENNTLARINSFVNKYPWLAKISNFFKNIKDKLVSRFKKDEIENKEIVAKAVKEYKENEENNLDIEEFLEETLVKDKTAEEKLVKGEDKTVEENTNSTDKTEQNDIINKAVEEIEDNKENEELKEIAKKGASRVFREKYAAEVKIAEEHKKEVANRYAEAKKEAANKYAKTYGGRYENQDGATVKKDDGFEH